MKFRPKKKIVEHALDSLVIEILLEPSHPKLSSFKNSLSKLQDMGYKLESYTKIYEELKKDYDQYQKKWRNGPQLFL